MAGTATYLRSQKVAKAPVSAIRAILCRPLIAGKDGPCVRHSIFCGKDWGLTIYVNPANMPKLIGQRG